MSEYKNSTLNTSEVYTLRGTYKNNVFTTSDGDVYYLYAFRNNVEEVEGQEVFVLIKYIEEYINSWVIYEYVFVNGA